jgi:hypothetical protein
MAELKMGFGVYKSGVKHGFSACKRAGVY